MPEAVSTPPSQTTSTTISGLLKWIGGIAASVITAVLIYHLIPSATPPSPVQNAEFYGVVADATSRSPVPNATVALVVGQNSVSQHTDNLGQYNVVLEGTGAVAVMGDVTVSADGYKPYSNTVALQPGNNFAEITLLSNAPAVAVAPPTGQQPRVSPAQPAPSAAAAVAPPSASAITFRKPPPSFVRRTTQVILHAKPYQN